MTMITGEVLLAHETGIRFGGFASLLVLMLVWQRLAPRRPPDTIRRRWPANVGLVVIDVLTLRLLLPVTAVGAAGLATEQGWGLFNRIAAPHWLEISVAVVLLDLAIYVQHVATHRVPLLWRLHRVHHSDIAFDATTALRFHPAEIVLSMLFKIAVIVALGAPAIAVLAFEVLLNATAVFNHGNVRVAGWLDRQLRRVLVTPDMHRVHHSVHPDETDSNYGFCLSWWDRLFRTYRPAPREGHLAMTIGLAQFREDREQHLGRLLVQPLARS
jgi:sterol desaturase/sphingolipid hydroxylase (fatty acid hydroxylase superfamily)